MLNFVDNREMQIKTTVREPAQANVGENVYHWKHFYGAITFL